MNDTWKSGVANICQGSILVGKWFQHEYQVEKVLGYGATGIVYLVSGKNGQAALKISDNSASIASEVNVLKHFAKVPDQHLGPCLVDVDDWYDTLSKKTYHFYVMEYIYGTDLFTFVEHHGETWIFVFIIQLLSNLEVLHEAGWVFGDLKPDNLIVSSFPYRIRLLDVGGTTLKGRSIKEYTEFFDRGYWGIGSRKAESSYDLFAVMMIMINLAHKKKFTRKENGKSQIESIVKSHPYLETYQSVFSAVLQNQYQTATEMKEALLLAKRGDEIKAAPSIRRKKTALIQTYRYGWLETLFIIGAVSLGYFFYIFKELL